MKETYKQMKGLEMEARSIIREGTYKVTKTITQFIAFIVMFFGGFVGGLLMQLVSLIINTILIAKGSWHTNFQTDGKHTR